jgi:hypothetical protein
MREKPGGKKGDGAEGSAGGGDGGAEGGDHDDDDDDEEEVDGDESWTRGRSRGGAASRVSAIATAIGAAGGGK